MFTNKEHLENLDRLNIDSYEELVGKNCYYVKPSYGLHKIISYDDDNEKYLLGLEGTKFYSNPFKIKLVKNE